MLKLAKSQYLNSICQFNYTRYEKASSYEIGYYKKIYKFEQLHFFIGFVFFFLV